MQVTTMANILKDAKIVKKSSNEAKAIEVQEKTIIRACPFYLSSSEKLLRHLSFKSSIGWWVPLDSSVHLVSELPRRS